MSTAVTIVDQPEDLCRKRFYNRDFKGKNLVKRKLRQSLFMQCNFDEADMSEADCEGSEFFGSTFRNTICYRTNFKDAKLAGTLFEPKDCFGITLTLQCKTFDGMKVSPLWWWGWIFFGTMLHPLTKLGQDDLRDGLIAHIGTERYLKLVSMFGKRDM